MVKHKVKKKECQLTVKVKLSFKEKLNERQLDFFSAKYIGGLMKAKKIRKGVIEYYGPIGISLYERLKKPIRKYDFLFIMEQVVDVVQKLNANALIINNVIFDIKSVFINETTRELQFIYLPLEKIQKETNILDFIEKIIYSAKPLQEEDVDYISRFVYFIKSLKIFDEDKVEKYIQGEDRSVVSAIKRYNMEQSEFIIDKTSGYYKYSDNEDSEATGLLYDNQATGLLNEEDEATGLLNENNKKFYYATLYGCLTGELISINKPVFRIGKEKSYSDYFISSNDKVSRSHADIITRGQRFFVMDLNSKNRTYINEKVLPGRQEVEIFNKDKISFANEEFEFRI